MKLNIRNKLLLAFAAVVLLTGVIGYIGYDAANRINTLADTIYENHLQGIVNLKNAVIDLYSARTALRSSMLTTDAQLTEQQIKLAHEQNAKFEEDMTAYQKTIETDQARHAEEGRTELDDVERIRQVDGARVGAEGIE